MPHDTASPVHRAGASTFALLAVLSTSSVARADDPGPGPDPQATPPGAVPAPPPPAPAAAPPPATDASLLGGPGESCRARSDCRTGLACVQSECVDENEGTTCGATADCGSSALRCIDHVCQSIHRRAGGRGRDDDGAEGWMSFKPRSGVHPYVGVGIGGGPTLVIVDPDSDDFANLHFVLRGGVLLEGAELGLEIAPKTAFVATDVDSHFSLAATFGGHLPISDHVSWPLRAGIGFYAVDTPGDDVYLQARADLLGIAVSVGHLLLDFHLPSFRYATQLDDVHILQWVIGMNTSYVF